MSKKLKVNLQINDSSTDSTPTITISGEDENLGCITMTNIAASSMLGYNRNEILSKMY